MPRYVLDSSVLLCAFLPDEDGSDTAVKLLRLLITGDVAVLAPRNMVYEFCGAMDKAVRRHRRDVGEAVKAIIDLLKLPVEYVEWEGMLTRTMELSVRYNKSWYDMCYFAVAERDHIPVCTADRASVSGLPEDFPCEYVLLEDSLDTE
ncbi:MAG: type II toxin-antitoxin system VapC family toxin [Planctomycetes bacterium]|nr:type II toxin-antitoxin system VapC family toxin [Planctomycetota bacterium]